MPILPRVAPVTTAVAIAIPVAAAIVAVVPTTIVTVVAAPVVPAAIVAVVATTIVPAVAATDPALAAGTVIGQFHILVGASPRIQGTSDAGLDQILWQDSVGQFIQIDHLLKNMNLSNRPGNPSFLKIAHVQRQSQAGERRDNAEDQGELQDREPT